jgi:hypothetical protein
VHVVVCPVSLGACSHVSREAGEDVGSACGFAAAGDGVRSEQSSAQLAARSAGKLLAVVPAFEWATRLTRHLYRVIVGMQQWDGLVTCPEAHRKQMAWLAAATVPQ